MGELVFIDGKFFKKLDAKISVFDHGLLYADGIFETMRSYNKSVFMLKRHLDRLYSNASLIRLKMPVSKAQMSGLIYKAILKNRLKDAYIKVLITRGIGEPGLNIDTCKRPSLVIITKQAEGYPKKFYTNGMSVKVVNIRQNNHSPLPSIKSFNYLNNILAKLQAKDEGFMDAVLLNVDGFVAEATASNIFIVDKEDNIITPSLKSGILPGVTRKVIIDIARSLRLKVCEIDVKPNALLTAKEVFLTNSIGEVLPVVKINEKKISGGYPGPISQLIHKKYKALTLKK